MKVDYALPGAFAPTAAHPAPPETIALADGRRIALALGSGGARGLAHIVVLEALDDLGLRPVEIAGSSMGAILGAAYAAGHSGDRLRQHLMRILRNRRNVMARLLEARVGRFAELLTRGLANPVLVDGEVLLGLFWPPDMPERFEDLAIPLQVVTTDYFGRGEAVIRSGDLRSAVAASMAIPGLVKPVRRNDLTLIDGGAVNPLPYDLLKGAGRIVIACDVAPGPVGGVTRGSPSPFEAMFGAAQIMQNAITAKMLQTQPPDILLRPRVETFRALDFFRFGQILRAAETMREDIRRGLEAALARA